MDLGTLRHRVTHLSTLLVDRLYINPKRCQQWRNDRYGATQLANWLITNNVELSDIYHGPPDTRVIVITTLGKVIWVEHPETGKPMKKELPGRQIACWPHQRLLGGTGSSKKADEIYHNFQIIPERREFLFLGDVERYPEEYRRIQGVIEPRQVMVKVMSAESILYDGREIGKWISLM